MPRTRKAEVNTAGPELYRAPGLEKGFDLIETLAAASQPLTVSEIAQRMGRSVGEMFRIVQVMERRGYLTNGSEGYSLSSKLFTLGIQGPPARNMTEIALPIMRHLAATTAQSCHLAFRSQSDMVVVARMESADQLGFSVRVGYRRPLHRSTSGRVLLAFQPAETQAAWFDELQPRPARAELAELKADCEAIRAAGHARAVSPYTEGVIDLAAPILRGERAAAALAIPYLQQREAAVSMDQVIGDLVEAAHAISTELVLGDSRI